jgi:hypothetical protein
MKADKLGFALNYHPIRKRLVRLYLSDLEQEQQLGH